LESKVFLVQTDTTVGFVSQDSKRLVLIKKRPQNKPFLISVGSFETHKTFARTPKKFRRFVRNSKRITFVFPNHKALRTVKDKRHKDFIDRFGWLYSTSANESGKDFDISFAKEKADIIVEDRRSFFEGTPSSIYLLTKTKLRRLR
jgi:tRNA A37 threonylcarbamoyladenosine synthetase subunit TsaC/SUA5/YrdC